MNREFKYNILLVALYFFIFYYIDIKIVRSLDQYFRDPSITSLLFINPIASFVISYIITKKYKYFNSLILIPGIVNLIVFVILFSKIGIMFSLIYSTMALIGATLADINQILDNHYELNN